MLDLITLIYLFAIARFFFAISGLDTGSPFTALGSSRGDARRAGGADPAVGPVGGGAGRRLDPYQRHHRYPLPLAGGAQHSTDSGVMRLRLRHLYRDGQLPFDLAEAEQELQEGPLSEYSGSGFGILKWGISLKQLVVLQMFVGVFPWGQMTSFSVGGLLLALVVAIVKLVVGVLIIALFENSMARLRFVPPPASPGPGLVSPLAFVSLLVA